jgi:hypothetical protein
VGSLGLRGLLGLWFFCCDGVCGFAGFWVCGFFVVMMGLWFAFFYGGLRWINSALRWWICT